MPLYSDNTQRFPDQESEFADRLFELIDGLSARISDFGMTDDDLDRLTEAARKLKETITHREEKLKILEVSQRELDALTMRIQVARGELEHAQSAARQAVIDANSVVDPIAEFLIDNWDVPRRFLAIHGLISPPSARMPEPPRLKVETIGNRRNKVSWEDLDKKINTEYTLEITYVEANFSAYRGRKMETAGEIRVMTMATNDPFFIHDTSKIYSHSTIRYSVKANDGAGHFRVSPVTEVQCL